VTVEQIRSILADHDGPEPICRHARSPQEMETVFWAIADLSAGEVEFGIGAPCESEVRRYRFSEN
jgi:hypothetical protein